MQIRNISIPAKDGAKIVAKIYDNEDSALRAMVIVCHGFGEHSGSFKDLAAHLVSEGYGCLVFTQRGHGALHPKKLGVIPGYGSFLDDIESAAAEVKSRLPGCPIILYGHSMGGNIAINYIIERGASDFVCAVLESPWLGLYKEVHPAKAGILRALGRIIPDVRLPEKETKLAFSDITSDESKQKEFQSDALYHNKMSIRLIRDIVDRCLYATENAPKFTIPTFLAIAKNDRIVCNKAALDFYGLCKNNIKLKEYDSQHGIRNDVRREDFFADVTTFLSKR